MSNLLHHTEQQRLIDAMCQARWFPHKNILNSTTSKTLSVENVDSATVKVLLQFENTEEHYLLPANALEADCDFNSIWTNTQWLTHCHIDTPIPQQLSGDSKLISTDSTNPLLRTPFGVVKFYPKINDPSLDREWYFANLLRSCNGVHVAKNRVFSNGIFCGLLYEDLGNTHSLWTAPISNKSDLFEQFNIACCSLIEAHHFFPKKPKIQLHLPHKTWASIPIQLPQVLTYFPSEAHDDCHLGQWIQKADQWVLIDFGGTPLKNDWWIGESCLEFDIASLIRSIDYKLSCHQLPCLTTAEISTLASFASEVDPKILAICLWVRAQYEIDYELKFRPEFAAIPQQALKTIKRYMRQVFA